MMYRKDLLKSHVLSWRRKVYSDWEDVTFSSRAFQVFVPPTGKARLLTVDHLTSGTRRWLAPVEWSDRLRENCVLAWAVQGTALHFREELWWAGRSYIWCALKHVTSEDWPAHQWCAVVCKVFLLWLGAGMGLCHGILAGSNQHWNFTRWVARTQSSDVVSMLADRRRVCLCYCALFSVCTVFNVLFVRFSQ